MPPARTLRPTGWAIAVHCIVSSPLHAQTGWHHVDGAGGPSAAKTPEVAYDTGRKMLVLYAPNNGRDEVWETQAGPWQLQEAGELGMLAVVNTALVFDQKRGVSVMYGGESGFGSVSYTWEWDGHQWTSGFDGPSNRFWHAMVYDSNRDVSVMFGGIWPENEEVFDDTWEYSGLPWKFATQGVPSARSGHAMTYDSWRDLTLMYGGGGLDFDLWAWNGKGWTLLFDNGAPGFPQNRFGHSMVFDARSGVALLFGGHTQGGVSNDLWQWDGAAWTKLDTPGAPEPRAFQAMVYDPDRHRLVLFGGQDADGNWLNDTWEYILPEPPCYPDLDGNGTLDLFDFLSFTNLFNAGGDSADCDASGVLDLFDFLCFTNAFNAGC